MYRTIIIAFLMFLPIASINSQSISEKVRVETEEKVDMPPDDILLGKRKAYWKICGKRIPSNLRYLTDADVIIILSGCMITILIFTLLIAFRMSKDSWHDGYNEGIYSKLVDLAKLRYTAVDEVCIVNVPEEVWEQLHDEFTTRSWYNKRLRKIKKWLAVQLDEPSSSDD